MSSLFASMSRAKGKMTISHLTQDQPQQPLAPIIQPIDVPRRPLVSSNSPLVSPSPSSNFIQQPNVGTQLNGPTIEHQSPKLLPLESSRSLTPTQSNTATPQYQERSYPIPQQPSLISSSSSSPASSPPAPYYFPTDIQVPPSIEVAKPILRSADSLGVTFANPSKDSTAVKRTTSNSFPSSVDDRILSLPPTPPAYLSPTFSSQSVMSSGRISASSRFTLSLPLPWSKVPPDGKNDVSNIGKF